MGQFFLGEIQSRIYPNTCAKFGCGPTVVSKRGGGGVQTDIQTDKGTLQLYIVEDSSQRNRHADECIMELGK